MQLGINEDEERVSDLGPIRLEALAWFRTNSSHLFEIELCESLAASVLLSIAFHESLKFMNYVKPRKSGNGTASLCPIIAPAPRFDDLHTGGQSNMSFQS